VRSRLGWKATPGHHKEGDVTRGYDSVTEDSLDTGSTREMIHKRGMDPYTLPRVRIETNMRFEEC
jgi:hypothetical protein